MLVRPHVSISGARRLSVSKPDPRVLVDVVAARDGEDHLAAALSEPPGSFLDPARLVYMKLRAGRLRDRGDVAGLINAGIDVDACRAYLQSHAPDLVAAFEDIVSKAADED